MNKVRKKFCAGVYERRFLLLLIIMPLMIGACGDQKKKTITWTEYEPVYMSQEEFAGAVQLDEPREMSRPGKIYFHDGFLFVNELNKGIHIIDNSDPADPSKVGFINIPASKDLAVKGDLLYADSHSDLLVFDIGDMQNPELVSREENVFEQSAEEAPGTLHSQIDQSKGVVVDWEPVEVEEVCEGNCWGVGPETSTDGNFWANAADGGGSESSGVGGSMARFTITGDHLYAVDRRSLFTFDIASEEPRQQSKKDIGWAIETIFPYEDNLFIGSASAMYIYDISDPDFPAELSVYEHFTACDPVVVENDLAYVTLRSGNSCRQGVNRLEIIDVEDRLNPKEIAFYEMINPHGLGIDEGILFISEGEHGLKVMDATDPKEVEQLRHFKEIKTFDVIPFNDVLMVTGEEGILQYDYSDPEEIKLLSTLPIEEG